MNLLSELLINFPQGEDFSSPTNTKSAQFKNEIDRIIWFTEILRWIQRPRNKEEKQIKQETIYSIRLRFILQTLDKHPDSLEPLARNIESVGTNLFSPYQLAQAGLPQSTSFLQDLWVRFEEKLLPQMPLNHNLSSMILEAFPDESESILIDQIDLHILEKVLTKIPFSEDFKLQMNRNLLLAVHMLCMDILYQAQLLTNAINNKKRNFTDLAEYQLETHIRNLIDTPLFQEKGTLLSHSLEKLLSNCETQTQSLFKKMENSGVKTELVYGFHNYRRRFRRLKILLTLLSSQKDFYPHLRLYISQTIIDVHQQRGLLSFLSENLTLLTQRIVQSNSHIGEHYVAFTWNEFLKMFYAAMGGGLLTSMTVFIKQAISTLGLTGLLKGLAEGINYSGSFLLIQNLGFTLATKQPSSTALYLAKALEKSISESRRTIIALLRTQFIAVLGNVMAVTPICFAVGWLFHFFGSSLYSEEHALEIIRSNSILSFAPLYAAITGVFLFTSSLIAGWFENFSAQKQISLRIRENAFLRKHIGSSKTLRLAQFFEENSNAFAGNFALGLILGIAPQFIKFLGVPIEIRHVTLATGNFATAITQAIDAGISTEEIINAILGITTIGILNIAVSFSLAFVLASVSTKVSIKSLFKILTWGLQLIITKPWLLVIPEKNDASLESSEK